VATLSLDPRDTLFFSPHDLGEVASSPRLRAEVVQGRKDIVFEPFAAIPKPPG